jgi:hypothetical protein
MNMEKERALIHKVLDGDASPEEKKLLFVRCETDPAFKEEFEALAMAVRILKESKQPSTRPSFTSEVMKKLPRRQASLGESLQKFFFKGNGIRWGITTAAAAAVLVVLTFALIGRLRTGPGQVPMVSSSSPQVQTVMVNMSLYAPKAHRVAVAGNFNKWNADDYIMTRQNNGMWTISLPLEPGVYAYMFVVDNTAWVTDPNAGLYRNDGFGYKNAVKRVFI